MKKQLRRITTGAIALVVAAVTVLAAPTDVTAATKLPAGITKIGKQTLTICFEYTDDGAVEAVNNFKEAYPQYADRIELRAVMSGEEQSYGEGITEAMKRADIDLVAWPEESLGYAMTQDYIVPLSKIGFKKTWYKNAYTYTKTNGSKDGKLMAVTREITPGCYIYNTSQAKKAFGTVSPSKVQKKMKNWNSFLSAAGQAAKKNIKIVQGADDIFYPFFNGNKKVLEINGSFQSITGMRTYWKVYNTLLTKKYTNGTVQGSSKWNQGFTKASSIGYFGGEWMLGTMYLKKAKLRKWAVIEGPQAYSSGTGIYYAATKNCDNPGLAQLFLYYTTCDTNAQYQNVKRNQYLPNNRKVMAKLIRTQIGRQIYQTANDPYVVFDRVAKKIKGREHTKYDETIRKALLNDSRTYTEGQTYSDWSQLITQKVNGKIKEQDEYEKNKDKPIEDNAVRDPHNAWTGSAY